MSKSFELPRPNEFAEYSETGSGACDPFNDYQFIDNQAASQMVADVSQVPNGEDCFEFAWAYHGA
jgi:hypothetical protein